LAAVVEARRWTEVAVVAASNGCSAAVRLAVDRPDLVARLLLAWPATAAESVADALSAAMIDEVGPPGAAARLLTGDTLRGVGDDEIESIAVPVAIWPSAPENQFHQGRTVMSLLRLLAEPILVGGSPEPGHRAFGPFVDRFVEVSIVISIVDADDAARQAP
jgi:pimeloyl-ACP methyl ester carboxylesterase